MSDIHDNVWRTPLLYSIASIHYTADHMDHVTFPYPPLLS